MMSTCRSVAGKAPHESQSPSIARAPAIATEAAPEVVGIEVTSGATLTRSVPETAGSPASVAVIVCVPACVRTNPLTTATPASSGAKENGGGRIAVESLLEKTTVPPYPVSGRPAASIAAMVRGNGLLATAKASRQDLNVGQIGGTKLHLGQSLTTSLVAGAADRVVLARRSTKNAAAAAPRVEPGQRVSATGSILFMSLLILSRPGNVAGCSPLHCRLYRALGWANVPGPFGRPPDDFVGSRVRGHVGWQRHVARRAPLH